MKIFTKFVDLIITANKIIAFVSIVVMMLAVTLFSITRAAGFPMVGNIEIVQLLMVVLIVGALAFTEKEGSHIKIGIIVDNFSPFIQKVLDLIAYAFLFIFCAVIVWSTFLNLDFNQASDLLRIPYYPFKILIIIGFSTWGLEGIRKLIYTFGQSKTDS
ncbi:TRAP transporter small permease subunit [Planococcus salinus]|uniref:TRAP transporter small permease n=1 Tax=Planococcus salinus TaxID=1848460 RepID=A0A3M8P810_9BACL|nr:TRAP transporter small permease [Planococcus salinus]RNF39803.1 TRAP transporter small permease [Planococcus salinus]